MHASALEPEKHINKVYAFFRPTPAAARGPPLQNGSQKGTVSPGKADTATRKIDLLDRKGTQNGIRTVKTPLGKREETLKMGKKSGYRL